ncbi:MAG: class I tRNA ligase family protein, partial [Phycisphaerales bacterium]|nr:class I tRNA ligase family protein [Phycisphaerales bacterium]
ALNVDDLMKDFGADVCRWWLATISYEGDIKADVSFLQTAGEAYRKVRNTLRFMLSNLSDFEASPAGCDASSGQGMCVAPGDFPPTGIDAWVLGEYNRLAAEVVAGYNGYAFQRVASKLYNFCNDTLSAVYLAAVKDRLYCDRADSPRRRRTQSTMWDLVDGLCRLLAPILPHTADEAFRALRGDESDSVHLHAMISDFPVTADPRWDRVMSLRDEALKALEDVRSARELDNPLDAGLSLPSADGLLEGFDLVDLADLHGVSRVALAEPGAGIGVADLRSEPRCERSWKRDGTVRERADGGLLSDRDAEAVGV